jgi:arylesterase/paraoxonase
MNIDIPGTDGSFGARRLQITGDYEGSARSRDMDPNGFDVEVLADGKLKFWMVNLRPSVDAFSGEYLDGAKAGMNGTVESFELTRGVDELRWTGTWGADSEAVHSPNSVAADMRGGFVATNDHSAASESILVLCYYIFMRPA